MGVCVERERGTCIEFSLLHNNVLLCLLASVIFSLIVCLASTKNIHNHTYCSIVLLSLNIFSLGKQFLKT